MPQNVFADIEAKRGGAVPAAAPVADPAAENFAEFNRARAATQPAAPAPADNVFAKIESGGPAPSPGLGGATAPKKLPEPSFWQRALGWDPEKTTTENVIGWDFNKPVVENVFSPTVLNAVDNVGLATGLIDPKTYRGRAPVDPNAVPVMKAPEPRGTWDIMRDSATDMFSAAGQGINSALMRTGQGLREEDLINQQVAMGRITREQADADLARTRAGDAAQIQEVRTQRAMRDAADPVWSSDGSVLNNMLREGASFAGGIAGDVNPTYLFGGELIPAARLTTPILERLVPALAPKIAPTIGRMASMGGVNAGIDAGIQGQEISEGIQDEFDPMRSGMSFAMGAALPGAIEGVPALRRWWASRGVKADHLTDEQLVNGSLDGSVTDGATSPDQVRAILQQAGATEPQAAAMSPQFAAMAADRVAQARARPVNIDPVELARQQGIRSAIDNGITDPSLAPSPAPRVVPDETRIIAAPEGNVRSDDAGGIAGLERKRAGDENFFERAQSRLADDPVVAEVLNAPISPQAKIKTLWDRIAEVHSDIARTTREVPWQAPTAESARTAGRPQATFDRMLGAESNGRQFGADGKPTRSNKGAVGIAQVMPATGPEAARYAGVKWDPARFENDAAYNEQLGRAYHAEMLRRFDGDERMAAAAYNAGPGRIDHAIAKGGRDGWEAHIPDETRGYLRKVMGERRPAPAPYRMSAPDEAGDAFYSSRERVRRVVDDERSPPVREDFQGWEKTGEQASPTGAELEAGKVRQRRGQFTDGPGAPYDSRIQTGGSTRAFKAVGDDPAGAPGFWEERSREQGDAAFARAQADLEAEWARRADARRQREEDRRQRDTNSDASQRYEQERANTASDPSGQYKGKYDQRPHKEGEFWRTTAEGYVAGKNGNPVAFRNSKDAAKFAVREKLGGDFDRTIWGANTERVVLQRREGSTYGQEAPPTNRPRTDFERAEPAAGRSSDTSQRAISSEARQAPVEPPAPEPPTAPYRPPAQSGGQNGPVGSAPLEEVVTPRGRTIQTRFEVHEARNLVTSDDARFDPRFQPRERGNRASSDAQIADIASKLDPEQVASSRVAGQGAPIVGHDRMVESGNGRVAAIRRAYDLHPERAAEYRKMIEGRGFDTSGMEHPVLVRRRTTELDDAGRQEFVREANERDTMNMSSTEQAKVDARSLSDETLAKFRGGDVSDAGNRDFARSWMNEVVAPSERNAMVMPDGSLSANGVRRMRSSVLARAFDDPALVAKIVEDPDSEIRAIGNALTEAAPALASVKAKVAAGDLSPEFDITPQIGEMASLIAKARSSGKPVGDFLKQDDIFSGRTDPVTEALGGIMFKGDGLRQPRSAREVGDALRFYADEALKIDKNPSLFGDVKPVEPIEIVQAAQQRLAARDALDIDTTGDMFRTTSRKGFYERTSEQSQHQLRDELDRIREAATGEYRDLADRLSKLVGDEATVAYGPRAVGADDLGVTLAAINRTGVLSRADHETILHEAVHLATIRRYGHNFAQMQPGDLGAAPVREILSLFNEARAQFQRGGVGSKLTTGPNARYALSSPDEFLAMSLTNRATQKWLQGGSLWDRLVDGVRKLLGFEPHFKPMLDRVLRAGTDVLDAAKGDRVREVDDTAGVSNKDFWGKVANQVFDGADAKADFGKFRESLRTPRETLEAVTRPMRNVVSGLVFTNDGVMRGLSARFKSEAINELADHFHARAGKGDGTGRTYHEAVQQAAVTRIGEAHSALEPFLQRPASLNRIRELLTHPNKTMGATAAEREAAGKLRDLLKETVEYRKAAGEDIGEVTDGYFPRVLDVQKVSKNRTEFLQKAEALYRSVGAEDPKASAEAWFARAFDTYSGLDGGLRHINRSGSGGIGGDTAKSREFGKEADRLLRDFYHDDVFQTLASYFTGAARRAEETRRFGPKGAVGSTARDAWEAKHGDKSQLDELTDRIKAEVKASGADAGDLLHRLQKSLDSNMGRLGSVGHNTRALISYVHAWNQLSKMDRTLVTSLGELTMGFIRGGPRHGLGYVKDTAVEFARSLASAHPSDAARWAEAVSVAQDAMVNQALTSRISAEGSTQGVQKMMAGFYKGILLHQFTEAERVAATRMGRHMLGALAGDIASPKARVRVRAERYLKELGVSDPQAFSAQLRNGEPDLEAIRRDAPGLASEYTTALIRFVNQTVIAPSRAEKPALSSHPVGSLFTSLLGYSFGFKKNVLDRAGRMGVDAFKEKDAALLLPAAMLPIMGIFQYFNDTHLRPALYGSNYDFSTETPTETAIRVADRAGFTGPMSPVVNAFKGIKYRRSLAESLSGPAIGSAVSAAEKIATPFVGNNSPNTNTAERNAAAALYDAAIEPLIDATAAKYLKGIPRTVAIMGTGNKRGGALPGDKDEFTDLVGGPKE